MIDPSLRQQLVARARTLDERLTTRVRPSAGLPSGEGDAGILAFWVRAFAGGDAEALARRLAWDGWTRERVLEAAASGEGDADAPWAAFLDEVLSRARLDGEEDAPPELRAFHVVPPFAEVWIPFVRAARARAERIEPLEDGFVAPKALEALEGALLGDLALLGQGVLAEHVESRRAAGAPVVSPSEHLEEILLSFPVLARLASTLATDWVAATCELLARLREDRAALADAFGATGAVTGVRVALADRHRGGRRVAIVSFQSGARVAYKPRTVGLEAEWNGFLLWLDAAGAPDAPPALRFVARDGYGWAEFAAPAALSDEAAAEAYFRRAGSLLAAAWLLGARDFHMDNVVATAAGPVVVDAEAILQPEAAQPDVAQPVAAQPGARGPRGAFDAANARLDASFLPTGLLTLEQADGEGRLSDVGGLNGAGGTNLPVLGGKPLKAEDRPAAVLRGFASAYRFLLARRAELSAADGPLSGFAGHRLRVVFRPSETYARLLGVLAAPRYLREGWVRSVALDALNRPFAARANPPALWPLARDERAALERMDIPYFDLGTAETEPVSAAGTRVAGHFARSGIDALKARLARMDEADLAAQSRLLVAFLSRGASSRAPSVDPAASAGPVTESTPFGSAEELAVEAVRLADGLLADAVSGEDGALLWIDPAAVRGADRRDRGSSYYLYDGGAGLVLFFAAVSAATGLERFRDAARRAALPIRRILDAPDLPARLGSEGLGALSGAGSIVYALAVAARLLGEEWPLDLARRAAALVTPERIAADTAYDVEGGSAGAILGLLALHAAAGPAGAPGPGALASAIACAEHLVAKRVELGNGAWGWPSADGLFLGGMAHGTSGIALALARIARATGREDFLGAARAARRHEAALYDEATRNWPALVKDGTGVRRLDMKAWCHGAPGIALSLLAAWGLDREASAESSALEIALEATRRAGLLSLDHACCGNAGLVEALAAAGDALARPELAAAADARLGAMLRRARLLGGFRLRATEEENAGVLPGFFRGQAGIGYTLLRRARPGLLPNVLAFEPPAAPGPGLEKP